MPWRLCVLRATCAERVAGSSSAAGSAKGEGGRGERKREAYFALTPRHSNFARSGRGRCPICRRLGVMVNGRTVGI